MATRKITHVAVNETRFGKLLIIGPAEPYYGKTNKTPLKRWACLCDCGNTTVQRHCHLVCGRVVSCGCHKAKLSGDRNRTHDQAFNRTPEYNTWSLMKRRCHGDTMEVERRNYRDRGIKVCERWLNSFENFFEDMGKRPSPKHSIERMDTNGDYEPSNCRWALPPEQARNRRNNRHLTYDGKTLIFNDMAALHGIGRKKLWHRLNAGWPLGRALTTP